MIAPCLAYRSLLKRRPYFFFFFFWIVLWHSVSEDKTLEKHCCEDLKSWILHPQLLLLLNNTRKTRDVPAYARPPTCVLSCLGIGLWWAHSPPKSPTRSNHKIKPSFATIDKRIYLVFSSITSPHVSASICGHPQVISVTQNIKNRSHYSLQLSIVTNEGFILWFDNTRNRMHTPTIKILPDVERTYCARSWGRPRDVIRWSSRICDLSKDFLPHICFKSHFTCNMY
jgi:hypothetical protein